MGIPCRVDELLQGPPEGPVGVIEGVLAAGVAGQVGAEGGVEGSGGLLEGEGCGGGRAAVSAWILAARVLPRPVTQLASTAVPPVTAAIAEVPTVLSPT